jgi:hypothetical protein
MTIPDYYTQRHSGRNGREHQRGTGSELRMQRPGIIRRYGGASLLFSSTDVQIVQVQFPC